MPKDAMSDRTARAQHSPSNRARCRECKDQINKGMLRVGVERNSMMTWYHPECFRPPQWLGGLSDIDIAADVTTKEKADLRHVLETHATTKAKSGASDEAALSAAAAAATPTEPGAATPTEPEPAAAPEEHEHRKRRAGSKSPEKKPKSPSKHKADEDDDGHGHGHGHNHDHAGRKRVRGEETDRKKLWDKYDALTVNQLKAILHCNDQVVTGVKADLVDRCIDGEIHGALPRCPQCKLGHLHVHYLPSGETRFSCAGHFDSSIGYFVSCPFKASDVHRSRWAMPGERHIKEEEDDDDGNKGKGGSADDQPLPSFSPDIETMDPKNAATAVLGLCRRMGLSLPKNDSLARVAVGSLLLRNRHPSSGASGSGASAASAAASAAASEEHEHGKHQHQHQQHNRYDVKATLRAALARYPPAAAAPGELPATPNGELAQLFSELAAYEGHIGERWKMMAYQHAAATINNLPFKLDKHKHGNGYLLQDEHHIENLGKGSVHKIEEYLETGKISELEDFRAKAESGDCF